MEELVDINRIPFVIFRNQGMKSPMEFQMARPRKYMLVFFLPWGLVLDVAASNLPPGLPHLKFSIAPENLQYHLKGKVVL